MARTGVAATIAALLAVTSISGAPAASAETFEEAVIRLVNEYRVSGLSCVNESGSPAFPAVAPVVRNDRVAQAAQNHSNYMTINNVFSHNEVSGDPGFTGADVGPRMTATGYGWAFAGENIAAGNSAPEATVQQWVLSSTGHCRFLMSSSSKDAGVGYSAKVGTTYQHYWTLNMGSLLSAVAAGAIDGSVSTNNTTWVAPSTLEAPTTTPWWVNVGPPMGGTGTYRVEVWNNSTNGWGAVQSGLTSSGPVQLPALIAAQVNADQQVKVRSFVYGPAGADGVNTAGAVTTLQFKVIPKPSTITLNPPTTTTPIGGSFTLSGSITSGVPVGSNVLLLCLAAGGQWTACPFSNGARVTGNGAWSSQAMDAPAVLEQTIKAEFPAINGWLGSSSSPVNVPFSTANMALNITGPAATPSGSYPTLTGSTSGIPTGSTIDIQQLIGGTWTHHGPTSVVSNAFSYALPTPAVAATTWRAVFAADSAQQKASDPFTVQVDSSNAGTTPTPVPPSYVPPATTSPDSTATTPTTTTTSPQIPITIKNGTVTGKLAKKQVRKVKVQRQTSAGAWKSVKTKQTSKATGKVKFYSLKKGTQYRLYAPQKTLNGATLPGVQSRTFTR